MTFSDALPVQFWLANCETFNEKEVDGIFRRCFCAPFNASDEITIQFQHTSGYTYTLEVVDEDGITINETAFTEIQSGIYQKSFTPLSLSITDEQIQLQVNSNSGMVAKSDCLDIREDHEETVLFNYTNNRIFASLNPSVGTPNPEFNLRIPGVFFHERHPRESESITLSDNTSIQTFAEIKKQRRLDVKHMPDYMHLKTVLVLSHSNVEIDGLTWKLDESYDKPEGNRKFPLKSATAWLTQRNYNLRNVL